MLSLYFINNAFFDNLFSDVDYFFYSRQKLLPEFREQCELLCDLLSMCYRYKLITFRTLMMPCYCRHITHTVFPVDKC